MLTAITHELEINIGGMPILVRTESPEFVALLQERYGSFAEPKSPRFGFRCSGSVKEDLPSRIPNPEARLLLPESPASSPEPPFMSSMSS